MCCAACFHCCRALLFRAAVSITKKSEIMSEQTNALKAQFDLHTRLFTNATEGIADHETNSRTSEHVNHIKWIAGHLLNTRLDSMSRVAGLAPDTSYGDHFGRGKALDTSATYPPIDEIRQRWASASGAISNGIAQVPDEVLNAKSQAQVPIADDTVRGLLSFLISHEAYHIGQLGLLRKMAGKEAMSYKL